MSAAPKLKAVPAAPERNEARTALAERIERINAIRANLANARAESGKAWDALMAQSREVSRLEGELEKAPSLERRKLRKALQEGQEFEQDLRDHRNELEEKVKALDSSLDLSQMSLRDFVGPVIKADPAPAKLIATYRSVKAQFAALHATLFFLAGKDALADKTWDADPSYHGDPDPAWVEAFRALAEDPDPALPA